MLSLLLKPVQNTTRTATLALSYRIKPGLAQEWEPPMLRNSKHTSTTSKPQGRKYMPWAVYVVAAVLLVTCILVAKPLTFANYVVVLCLLAAVYLIEML